MKKLLALAFLFLTVTRPAFADHIGIYRDATAQSCSLDPGHSATTVVMHQYSLGADWVKFRVDFSNAPGSTFLSFSTSYYSMGSLTSALSISYYPGCMTGSVVLGTITAVLSPGFIEVAAPIGECCPYYDSCDFTFYPVTAGRAYIGSECIPPVATEQSTWGHVKALYR